MGHLSVYASVSPGPKEQAGGSAGAAFSPLPISQTSAMDRDARGDAGNTAGVGGGGGVDLDPPLPTPPPPQGPQLGSRGHSWAFRARELGGFKAPPRRGWDIKAGSAGACQTGFVSRAPSMHESLAVQTAFAALPTCIPDWSRPGPSCIPGLEEAEGPGPFVRPKSELRTMTG